jgi:hypothetical protein
VDLKEIQINWMRDILIRISEVNNNTTNYSDIDRKKAIDWLIKQALKVDRDE